MINKLLFSSLLMLATATAATAMASPVADHDFIFKAMSDELERSMSRLELKGHPKPYYISYTVSDFDTRSVTASFGAINTQDQNHFRTLGCDVRIGDYKQDSSSSMGERFNFASMLMGGEGTLSVDENYDALRRELWLQTDSAYKNSIERLKANETYLKQHTIEDKPDSMSKEEAKVHVEQLQHMEFDMPKWTQEMRKVSGVFKDYPNLRNSRADIVGASENRWFINTEGFKYRTGESGYTIYISAQTQAPDGMRLADSEVFPAWLESDLPNQGELEKSARALADRLAQIASAPIVSNYRGPVLFEGQAGGDFFHQLLGSKLAAGNESLFRLGRGGEMQEKLGLRFLPKFITVIDDPKAKEYNGQKLFGTYEVDDDGVEAQKITLIDKGILKTLCMGRVPTRTIKQSNGHSKNGTPETSNLFVISDNMLPKDALKAKLIELGKEDGLKEVYIVRKLLSSPAELGSVLHSIMMFVGGGGDANLYPPVLLYKVSTEDGHEELVRGGSFTNISMRVLRDIEVTGDDAKAYPTVGGSTGVRSIVAPSVLVKEIEIQRPERTNSKGPLLKNPYFEK